MRRVGTGDVSLLGNRAIGGVCKTYLFYCLFFYLLTAQCFGCLWDMFIFDFSYLFVLVISEL